MSQRPSPSEVESRPPVVTVFGGSRVVHESPLYREAYRLGQLLAEHGYVVCNGGYSGTMEAASRGCKEAGGRTIGVTIEIFDSLAPNEYLDEEVGTASLLMRLDKLTALADAYIVLTGSLGTLLEMALVWNLRSMHVYPDKPIILLGPAWKAVLECLREQLLVRDSDLTAFTLAETPEQAVEALSRRPASEVERSRWSG